MPTETTQISNSPFGDIELNYLRKPLDALVLVLAIPLARLAEPIAVAIQDQVLSWLGSESGILFAQLAVVVALQLACLRFFGALDRPWRQLDLDDAVLFVRALGISMFALLAISELVVGLGGLGESPWIGWLAIPQHEIILATGFVLLGLLAPRMARRINFLLGPRVRRARRKKIRQLRNELSDVIRLLKREKKKLESEIEELGVEKTELEEDRHRLLYNVAHLRELSSARERDLEHLKSLLLEQARLIEQLRISHEAGLRKLDDMEALSREQLAFLEASSREIPRKEDLEALRLGLEGAFGEPTRNEPEWLMIDKLGATHLVPLSDVLWFKAQRSDTQVMTVDGERSWRFPIKDLEKELAGSFVQLDRGLLVRADQVDRLETDEDAHLAAVLSDPDGSTFKISCGRVKEVTRWYEERSIRSRSNGRKSRPRRPGERSR